MRPQPPEGVGSGVPVGLPVGVPVGLPVALDSPGCPASYVRVGVTWLAVSDGEGLSGVPDGDGSPVGVCDGEGSPAAVSVGDGVLSGAPVPVGVGSLVALAVCDGVPLGLVDGWLPPDPGFAAPPPTVGVVVDDGAVQAYHVDRADGAATPGADVAATPAGVRAEMGPAASTVGVGTGFGSPADCAVFRVGAGPGSGAWTGGPEGMSL
jgi:hypothetical protein